MHKPSAHLKVIIRKYGTNKYKEDNIDTLSRPQ